MNADADIQVWLETVVRTQPSIIIPYVQSEVERTLHYQVSTVHRSQSGNSTVSQSGTVHLPARASVALSKLSVSQSAEDICYVNVELTESGLPAWHYQFDCSQQRDIQES